MIFNYGGWNVAKIWFYTPISPSPGSDLSTQTQLISAYSHTLFWGAREPVCAISPGARDLEILANKRATSQLGVELVYSAQKLPVCVEYKWSHSVCEGKANVLCR